MIMDCAPRASWTLGKVQRVLQDKKGHIRIAEVKTKTSLLQRPIDKLCVLVESD